MGNQYLAKYFGIWDNVSDFRVDKAFFTIKSTKNGIILWSITPVIQDATYTKDVY